MSSDSSSSSDESSDDESPRHVRSVAHGTYGEVVRELNRGGADIVWEGGDTSTLDADAYAAALKSYAKSPRAPKARTRRPLPLLTTTTTTMPIAIGH